jgi:predicted RNase H-like HicB family nuclease
MMTTYAVTLARRYDGLFTATFPDMPGVVAFGRDDEEALEEASKALTAAIARCAVSGDPLPIAITPGALRVSPGGSDERMPPPLMKWGH